MMWSRLLLCVLISSIPCKHEIHLWIVSVVTRGMTLSNQCKVMSTTLNLTLTLSSHWLTWRVIGSIFTSLNSNRLQVHTKKHNRSLQSQPKSVRPLTSVEVLSETLWRVFPIGSRKRCTVLQPVPDDILKVCLINCDHKDVWTDCLIKYNQLCLLSPTWQTAHTFEKTR